MYARDQVSQVEQRFDQRTEVRDRVMRALATGRVVEANPPSAARRRLERVRGAATLPAQVRRELAAPTPAPISEIALERVIGPSDLMNVNYLVLALRAARAVGRIRVRTRTGRDVGFGTGFLVSPRLVLTNHHVFPDQRTARDSVIDFGYELDANGDQMASSGFALDPQAFYLSDKRLDYALVAAGHQANGSQALNSFGWTPLIRELGKLLVGEFVNIIQHPNGERKQIALRQNQVVDLLDDFVHYHTDTNPGSSGSPVFNDQWEVVALHHSGVPRKDERGRILNRDGQLWRKSEGDDRIDWIANEGVRVSQLVAHVEAASLAGLAADLRAEMLEARAPVEREGVAPMPSPHLPVIDEVVVPLQLRLASATIYESPARRTPPLVAEPALTDYARARERPYYGASADEKAAKHYYASFTLSRSKSTNFARLERLISESHRPTLTYHQARMALYAWVDLQPDLMLRSVYSHRLFDPNEVIMEDIAIERAQQEAMESLRRDPAVSLESVAIAALEAVAPYNCEHVVPQSWFGKRDPMRSDLHHLFTCEWGCNSFRGNTPYYDFADYRLEVDRDACGRRIGDRFEPEGGKGAVARATLYFLLRYPGEVDSREFGADRLDTLLDWHRAEPPELWEKHRNTASFEVQGNRNPFIDRPEWAKRVDLRRGLALHTE